MSHGDEAKVLPKGFTKIATSKSCAHAAIADEVRHLYGVQFHPEVTHTEHGQEILKRFVSLCHADPWSVEGYAKRIGEEIKASVQDRRVFMLVSGGVDSSVAFTLLNSVLGPSRVQGLLVDTGLMRSDEVREVRFAFEKLGIPKAEPVKAFPVCQFRIEKIGNPKFGGDKNLFAGNIAAFDSLPHSFFIAVNTRGIDMAVARFQCPRYDPGGFGLFDLPYAKPESWHLDTVVEGDEFIHFHLLL